MDINVGDYLMAIDEISSYNDKVIKRFEVFEINKTYVSGDKYDVKLGNYEIVTIDIYSLRWSCIKLKFEYV